MRKASLFLIVLIFAALFFCPLSVFAEKPGQAKAAPKLSEEETSSGLVKLLASEDNKEELRARIESLTRLSSALRKLKESTNLE
ncbi:MAG: hypothetical protein H6757_05735 [Candidatus Omnitrophica bacterium]|nr:hypothetical protein [Candidatus Omnitrophota bacterium]